MDLYKEAHAMAGEIVAHRRFIHTNAEVGLTLPKTSAYVFDTLETLGYAPKRVGESGVVAMVGVGTGGKTLLLRADMDALPMQEESGLSFAACEGAAHTCGHDLHTAMLLGAAKLLKRHESSLKGTVKLMFQPAEETLKGALDMLEHGLLSDDDVDCAMAMHVFTGMSMKTVVLHEGPYMASSTNFRIDIQGKGAHGASPQQGVDPINIGVHIHLALQSMIAREMDYTNGALITIGKFVAGTTSNIIPDTAQLVGTMRTFNEAMRTHWLARLETICKATAETFRGEATVTITSSAPVLVNDAQWVRSVKSYVAELGDGALDIIEGERLNGSEDFAYICQKVPGLMLVVGGSSMQEGEEIFSAHNPKIVFDENVLPVGAAIYAHTAMRYLED